MNELIEEIVDTLWEIAPENHRPYVIEERSRYSIFLTKGGKTILLSIVDVTLE